MLTYDGFRLHGTNEDLLAFLSAVEDALPVGWSRNHTLEQRLTPVPDSGEPRCFECVHSDDRINAAVFLGFLEPTVLFLANIIPLEDTLPDRNRASAIAYGRVFDEFLECIIRPRARSFNVRIETESTPGALQ